MKPYLVALLDAPELPTDIRIRAETTYAGELEKRLGGDEAVADTLRAWTMANDSQVHELSRAEVTQATQWPRANDVARQAAFRHLGELPGAHFEVRLVKS